MKPEHKPVSIQIIMSLSFTAVAVILMLFLSFLLYSQFENRSREISREASEQLLSQTVISLEDYLRNMRRVSDSMYYAVIKRKDLADEDLREEMDILYEANKDKLVSIACYYSETGELAGACPISAVKDSVSVKDQTWFIQAEEEVENFHFSLPHVQNLFNDPSQRYNWVISLSRSVDLTRDGAAMRGVLLVDMNYSSIVHLLDQVNTDLTGGYVYLMDADGKLIYHPRKSLIRMGEVKENNLLAVSYGDQSTEEVFEGKRRMVAVKTVGYTGWKLVRVVPMEAFRSGMITTRYLMIILVAVSLLVIILTNRVLSDRITMPLRKLNESVASWEAGNMYPDIYIGGSLEVEHLGRTLASTVEQSRQLMDDIVVEQEEKRKSELEALQSQINPHFLYNTLDSILWMIQGERYDDAVYMIKQLASLFRISLSRGKTIISIGDELKHAQNYVNIQRIRYKNRFEVSFDVDPGMYSCCIVKLVLQPILENAIYYGMEYMDDGEGRIKVCGHREGDNLVLEVTDNGPGMPEEAAARLLTGEEREHAKGSGVGLINVHNRIRLRFGDQYGLSCVAHPDEGMTVRICLPGIPYNKENCSMLEAGRRGQV